MRKIAVFFILSLAFLAACSKKESSGLDGPQTLTFSSEVEARKVLESERVKCDGDCPDSVASFFLYHTKVETAAGTSHIINHCSATLIAPDQVLTNFHCIEGLVAEGDVLDPKKDDVYIEIKFPKTSNFEFESIKGVKILKASKNYVRFIAPDWAIIKLEKATKRKPVALSSESVANNIPVQLFPVYFDLTTKPSSGVIKQVKCMQSFESFGDIFAVDKESPLFVIDQCSAQLVHGNSGTGVFNEGRSKLIGVMSGNAIQGNAAQSNAVRGTLAHCLPHANAEECFYSDEAQYVEVYKQFSVLYSFIRDLETIEPPYDDYVGFHFDRSSFSELPKLVFNSPWSEDLAFLNKPESQVTHDKYISLYSKLFFYMHPTCVEAEFAEEILELPVFALSEGDLRPYVWAEQIVGNSQQAVVKYNLPELRAGIKHVEVQLTLLKNKKEVLVESLDNLPKPLKSFSFKLPLCH